MKKTEYQQGRFEFVLYINEEKKKAEGKQPPIICSRTFDIRGYNKEVLGSLELKELMNELIGMNNSGIGSEMGLIPNYLKVKSRLYLWDMYDEYEKQTKEDIPNRDIFAKKDDFTFELKVDDKVVSKGFFSGNYFPPKVRYQVNIKNMIPQIMSKIRDTFSMNKYTKNFETSDKIYDLNYLPKLKAEIQLLDD